MPREQNSLRLNTTISKMHYQILEKYKERYGSQKKTIEAALELLEKQNNPGLSSEDELWLKLRKECDIAAFSRVTARDIIAGKPEEAIKNNYLPFYLEWLYKKPIAQLSLEEVLSGLKKLLETINICKCLNFSRELNTFRVVGYIGMNYETSEFYAKYISYFLERYCNCRVVSSITDTGITLDIHY
ncbi:MAG: hypothetical protein QXJ68_02550 [Methanocellales archaeon]